MHPKVKKLIQMYLCVFGNARH